MKKEEVYDDEKLSCPYCNKLIDDAQGNLSECEHLIYAATDEGFMFIAKGIDLDKDDYDTSVDYDVMTDALSAKSTGESIKYISSGCNLGMDAYFGFEKIEI